MRAHDLNLHFVVTNLVEYLLRCSYLFFYESSLHILCTFSVVFFLLIYDSCLHITNTVEVLFYFKIIR